MSDETRTKHVDVLTVSGNSSVIASTDLPLPSTIGEYRPIRRLGEGGMGIVYAAEQRHPLSPGHRLRFRRYV